MRPLAEVLGNAASMTTGELQEQIQARDIVVTEMRVEMRQIHMLLEERWIQEARANAGPAELNQTILGGK